MQSKEELLQLAKDYLKTEAGKKLAEYGTDVENLKKQKDDIKQQLDPEQLKNRLKQYIPVIEKFKVKGRLYDKTTNTPINKAKITPILALGKGVRTDDKGQFTIELEIPILPANNKALIQTQLLVTKDKYLPVNLEVLTGSRMVKTDIKTKSLINLEKAAEEAANELRLFVNEKIDDAKRIALSVFEMVVDVRKAAIYKMMNDILFKLLPLGIQMLLIFGITKPSDLDKAICPTPSQLKRAINTRNKIVRQLNQIYKMVAINAGLAIIFNIIAAKLKEVDLSLAFTPALPFFPILSIQKVREILQKLIDDNKGLNIQLLVALIFLVAALIILNLILKALDKLIFRCTDDAQLVEVNEEFRKLAATQEQDSATIPPNIVNGFILEVQDIDQNEIGGVKRKQAVGKDSKGIILVKGEPSFSAGDTVLINELAFYIQSNDLKAY
tara:strand:- start:3059 stop:4381 length:1323 start_codon:yes stop_codon:yes gene_type:complete